MEKYGVQKLNTWTPKFCIQCVVLLSFMLKQGRSESHAHFTQQ